MLPYFLYTIQKLGHDLTQMNRPLTDYQADGIYYPLAQHLGWAQWAWCLMNPKHFIDNNGWMGVEHLLDHTMWTLHVPAEHVAWCSMDKYCEGYDPQNQIFPDPFLIRANDEFPMGLVQTPINANWIVEKEPARDFFKWAGLLHLLI